MKLLFITQKLHTQDRFTVMWVRAFQAQGYDVTVLCLDAQNIPRDFRVVSLGKEHGTRKIVQLIRYWWYVWILPYDRVFIHMSPIWGLLGFWAWVLRRTPVYLWYTHYKCSLSARVTQKISKRIFCATEQSVPWLRGQSFDVAQGKKAEIRKQWSEADDPLPDSKKIVVGHGIDLDFWRMRENSCIDPHELLVVHRLSRSKRLEINIRALLLLPQTYTMVIYGINAEKDYVQELHALVEEMNLQSRVAFRGTAPMESLPSLYTSHPLILNMASETIDKTMLEAMTCGCYPVTTRRNAEAIGLAELGDSYAPPEDTPEAVAAFITQFAGVDADALQRIVRERHSLEGLMEKMDFYIRKGS